MHIKYCKTDGQYVLTFGRQFVYTALIVPLDKRGKKVESFSLCFFLFLRALRKRNIFLHTPDVFFVVIDEQRAVLHHQIPRNYDVVGLTFHKLLASNYNRRVVYQTICSCIQTV